MSEAEKFLEDLPGDQTDKSPDILEQPLNPEPEKAMDTDGEDVQDDGDDSKEFKPKNRRERRLQEKLQQERESSIFLAGKLEARTEAERALRSEDADYLKGIERIYGTDTPEAQLATDLLKKAIVGARDDARESALADYKQQREQEIAEQREAEAQLDGFIDEIEDTYDVRLTRAQEQGYFQLLERMSPKDANGDVTEYADPHAVWEVFQDRLKGKGTDNRAKQLSSRSMVPGGAIKESKLPDDSAARFLTEEGII